jgi:hypothetical protein
VRAEAMQCKQSSQGARRCRQIDCQFRTECVRSGRRVKHIHTYGPPGHAHAEGYMRTPPAPARRDVGSRLAGSLGSPDRLVQKRVLSVIISSVPLPPHDRRHRPVPRSTVQYTFRGRDARVGRRARLVGGTAREETRAPLVFDLGTKSNVGRPCPLNATWSDQLAGSLQDVWCFRASRRVRRKNRAGKLAKRRTRV